MRSNTSVARVARPPELAGRGPKADRQAADAAAPSRFDLAAERAMARHSAAEWALLEPTKRTDAIYAELRRLDAEFSRKRGADRLR